MFARFAISLTLLALLPSSALARGCFPVHGAYHVGAGAAGGGLAVLAAEGSPVLAPLSGTVSAQGSYGALGSFVAVRAGQLQYVLTHLAPDSVIVHRGERVREGDFLAQVGHSGAVDGPLLGIFLWRGRRLLNPSPTLAQWRRTRC